MRLLVWGTGQLLYQTLDKISRDDVIGYIDTYKDQKEFGGKRLYKPYEINELEYDAILVSNLWAEEVTKTCRECGISMEKVIFIYSNIATYDLNKNYDFVGKICGKKYADFIKNRYHLIREIEKKLDTDKKEFDISDYSDEKYYRNDYVRLKTLELLVDEIKRMDINGAIAELGVFQGDFARYLNIAFSNRKLYLFDTFEGFDKEELEKEVESDVIDSTQDIYKSTSVQLVMDKIKYKEKVIIKKGFFPESLNGLEEKFALVSLDCDWEESLYQGLRYFYPRINGGGYIMLHDYNNFLDCAKKAVSRYEKDMGVMLHKVPVCDAQGSLIIVK